MDRHEAGKPGVWHYVKCYLHFGALAASGMRMVEQGNHEQLLAKKGRYDELYMTQFAGFAT